jgi:hypothetical protein
MVGNIDKIGEDLYVKYSMTFSDEPTRQTLWWKIERVVPNPFRMGWPAVGDEVTMRPSGGAWSGPGYLVYFTGAKDAEKVERVPVPCPATRGKPSRWNDGRWEKLLAKGWVPA